MSAKVKKSEKKKAPNFRSLGIVTQNRRALCTFISWYFSSLIIVPHFRALRKCYLCSSKVWEVRSNRETCKLLRNPLLRVVSELCKRYTQNNGYRTNLKLASWSVNPRHTPRHTHTSESKEDFTGVGCSDVLHFKELNSELYCILSVLHVLTMRTKYHHP